MTLTSNVKVKKATTDEEADGREVPDQTVGKRKGMCCTEGRPAQVLMARARGHSLFSSRGYYAAFFDKRIESQEYARGIFAV